MQASKWFLDHYLKNRQYALTVLLSYWQQLVITPLGMCDKMKAVM